MTLDSQYTKCLIEDCLEIAEGKGGFPFIKVENGFSTALVSIYGAQVLSYKPKQDKSGKLNEARKVNNEKNELLYVSESAYFEKGEAIKGGIPICWPWFGRDPINLDKQIHGFAQNMLWQLVETEVTVDGGTKIVLSLSESEDSLKLWPHNFKLSLTINIGRTLHLSLQTVNTNNKAFTITQALHAYFSVADISRTQVSGLDNVKYLDKASGANTAELQVDAITVNQEVDRIYIDAPDQTSLIDLELEREVTIKSKGSKTTVVWNPWVEISKDSADLSDDAYQGFICVETANAANDIVVLEPNESYIIEAEYSIASF